MLWKETRVASPQGVPTLLPSAPPSGEAPATFKGARASLGHSGTEFDCMRRRLSR
jgi:hypothetical protein